MLNTKRIQLFFSSLILLISLASFSGFTGVSTQTQKPQTELLTSTNSIWTYVKQNNYLNTTPLKVNFNQYTVFSFKFFLNRQLLDFNITLKAQKETTLQFLQHRLLEQNLIAQINTSNYKNSFIK